MYNYLYLHISPSVTILYPSKLSKFNETRMFHKSNETWFGEKSPLRSPTSRKLNLRIGFEFDNQPSVDSFSWFRYVSNDFNAFDILFDASSSRPFPPTPTTPVQPFHPKLASVVPPLGRPNFEGSPSMDRWYKEIEDENLKITRSWWRLEEVHRKWMKMNYVWWNYTQKKRGIGPNGWEDQMTSAAGIVSPKVPAMGKRPSTDVSLWPMAT